MKVFQNYWVEIIAILLVVVGIRLFWMKKREESIIPLILSLFTFFVGRGIFSDEKKMSVDVDTINNETIVDTNRDVSTSTNTTVPHENVPSVSHSFNGNTTIKQKDEPIKEANVENTTNPVPQPISSYPPELKSAISKAIDACESGKYSDAFNLYIEAADNYPIHSSSVRQNASQRFREKAEIFIENNNGKNDTNSKILLEYAQKLNPSSREIKELLNITN